MPYFCCLFITDSNCRTACKGQGIRDPLRSYSNNSFFFDLKVLNAFFRCLFITGSNCRTASKGQVIRDPPRSRRNNLDSAFLGT